MDHDTWDFAKILDSLLCEREKAPNHEGKPRLQSDSTPAWWVHVDPPTLASAQSGRRKQLYKTPVKPVAPKPEKPKAHRPEDPYIALDRLGPETIEAAKMFYLIAKQPLPKSVQTTELKRQYHRLAKLLHPDGGARVDGSEFRQLAQCYVVLQRTLRSLRPAA